jgi:hypothetical protein
MAKSHETRLIRANFSPAHNSRMVPKPTANLIQSEPACPKAIEALGCGVLG